MTQDFDDTLTQEEKDAENYLDWSNETLGRCTRWTAERFKQFDLDEYKGIVGMASAYSLIRLAQKANATTFTLTTESFTYKDENMGDWEVIVRKKS